MFKMILKSSVYTFLVMLVTTGVINAQTVTLDYYFNHETHVSKGQQERFHYMWEDQTNNGFSIWGNIFRKNGATLNSLDAKPTVNNLKGTKIYIIVDPDTRKESPAPNYILKEDVEQIASWVKAGGILVLMANDSVNVELTHFNMLAEKFGMHFNNDLQNHVINDAHFSDGAVNIANHPIFKTAKRVFLKDVCSIGLSGNAKSALKAANGSAAIAAIAKYGKGTVFAVGDPWLYNEYVNGRLPAEYENDKAASDLAVWLIQQAAKTKN